MRNIKPLVWPIFLFGAMMLTRGAYALSEAAPDLLNGKRLYRSYCLVCHGANGNETGPLAIRLNFKPADLSSKQYQMKTVNELTDIIKGYGRAEGSNMPNWGAVLPKTDLRDIAAYISKITRTEVSKAGDTRRGRSIYKSACIACHGKFGAGIGVLTALINVPVIDHTNQNRMKVISDEEITDTIIFGKGLFMPSFDRILNSNEIIDVTAYVRTLPVLTSQAAAPVEHNALEGRRLYNSYCFVCHGEDGKSIGPLAEKLELKPSDLSSEKYQKKGMDELAAIVTGYSREERSDMPNWGAVLSRTDLYSIAAYIAKLGQKDFTYEGDSRRGRAIFKGACVACHGQFGRGKGILAELINISMVDFTDSEKMAQLSDEDLINAIRNGKGAFMASWEKVFTDAEIVDVAAYVRSLTK